MKKSGFAWLPVITAIAAIGVVGWLYWYSQHQTEVTDNNPAVKELQSEVQGQKQPATTTAQQTQAAQPAQQISVSGMSKYTDADFGFSFWYPSGWTVKTGTYTGTNANEYPGGTLSKEIEISNGDRYVHIAQFHSSIRSITIPYYGHAEAGRQHFYFDTTRHQWMAGYPGNSDITGADMPADVSKNTMGGLHMFYASPGFCASDTIIPVSAQNFLILNGSIGAGCDMEGPQTVNEDFLAKTIVATDPSVATPVSTADQITIIQTEKAAYTAQ